MRKLFLVVSLFAFSGCGVVKPMTRQESKLSSIDVGMSRADVMERLGNPDDVKEMKLGQDGRSVRVDEYRLFKPGCAALNAILGIPTITITWWTPYLGHKTWSPYWVEYVDGKLSRIVRDIDWNPEVAADITVHQK